MPSFSSFESLEDALSHYQIVSIMENFVQHEKEAPLPISLQEMIAFNLEETAYNVSEAAICEAIIYPIMREVWRNFKADLFLWSHKSLSKKAKSSGIPDYIIAKRSPLGKDVMDLPILVMIEAKKDDFDAGWGQCVAQMHLANELNGGEYKVYGIVSNGDVWQFGYLQNNTLARNRFFLNISELQILYNALFFILSECEKQLSKK